MEIFFQMLAVILAGVAAYFLWQGSADRAFVAAVLGAVSFFLSVRFQVKERLRQREALREEDERREGEAEAEDEFEDETEDEVSEPESPQLNEMPAGEQVDNARRATNDELKAQTPRATDKEQI
jgi:hypothetical protein